MHYTNTLYESSHTHAHTHTNTHTHTHTHTHTRTAPSRHAPEDDTPFLEPHISMPFNMTLPPSADSFLRASFLHLT